MKKITSLIFMMFFANVANATIVTADFRTEGDLPLATGSAGPVVFEAIGVAAGVGPELNSVTPISNPSSWNGGQVAVDLDPTTNILTLTAQDALDFQTFLTSITNITFNAGETVTGISLLTNSLVDPTYVPTFSFTSNSVSVLYNTGTNDEFNFVQFGTATFQITTAAGTVPVPASLGLVLVGLIGLRKKIKS
jgi:hypothetical protein